MDMEISVPILNPDPLPVMLQPTVYDPSAKFGPLLPSPSSSSSLHTSSPADYDGLSPTQRSIEADLLAEAEEAAARSSALKRAKQAVITKLSREFSKRKPSDGGSESQRNSKESAAVVAGLSALNLGMNMPAHPAHRERERDRDYPQHLHHSGLSCASSSSVAYRLREGLFGKSVANVAVAPDHRSLESQTALVPLIFARS
jgi:hypothetical protein